MNKTLDFGFEIKSITDSGTFTGYGSVFGVKDSYGDIVLPGAFADSLAAHKAANRLPAMLWQHRSSEPIGVYKLMEEDSIGLQVEGQLALNTVRGAEAHALMKMGALTGLSIGYVPRVETYDKVTGINTLQKVDLWEVSPVTFPANDAARVTGVKSLADMTERDFEQLMQDAGLSRKEARAVMNHGFRHLKATQDAGNEELSEDDLKVIADALKRRAAIFATL